MDSNLFDVIDMVNQFNNGSKGANICYVWSKPNSRLFSKEWTFFSICEILENALTSKKSFFDVGTTYGEMGYIFVLGYIPSTQMFFVRPAGGSEYRDQLAFYRKYNNSGYDPTKFAQYNDDTNCIINVQFKTDLLHNIINFNFMDNTHGLLCLDKTLV